MKSRSRRRARPAGARAHDAEPQSTAAGQPVAAAGQPAPAPVAPGPAARPAPGAGGIPGAAATVARTAGDALERWFVPIALGILLIAAALRLPELALNPFHHDEGVNGFFTTRLVRSNIYHYDPANYHGPSLYYFALASEILFGLTTESLRLVPVLAGIATVALVLPLRPFLGSVATLVAAGLLAISPGAVYISRYFIHEAPLVCFSLALVVSALLYLNGRGPLFLLTGAASAALIFATKETGIITVVVLIIAAVVADRYVELRDPGHHNRQQSGRQRVGRQRADQQLTVGSRDVRVPGGSPVPRSIVVDGVEYRPVAPALDAGAGRTGGPRRPSGRGPRQADGARGGGVFGTMVRPTPVQLLGAGLAFAVIWVLLFSSFFTNWPKGLLDSVATFTIWTQTGAATQVQPVTKYLEWMAQAEAPLLLLGVAGGALVAFRGTDRLSVFIGLWALGLTLVYSLIQYKTPWIVLNMLIPLALLAGILVRELLASRVGRQAVPILLAGSVVLSGYQAIDLNYRHYDDETYPYVFVHSTREMLTLVDAIDDAAARSGAGKDAGIVILSPDYWPLPWYLRDYPRAGYYGTVQPTLEPIVIVRIDQEKELPAEFTTAYSRQSEYTLRPGVRLVLYLRRDAFGL